MGRVRCGAQTDRGSDTFSYDHENRLLESIIGGVTSMSAYNGDGLRMSLEVDDGVNPPVTTDYVWDVNRPLPVVLDDGTNRYVYGLDLIASIDGSGAETYYTYDGLGSTTDLTDDTATVTDTYSYDVFGDASHDLGTSANPWLFTGEQNDADSGLYYLRARHYDPAIGRFLSQDPIPWEHPYSYVASDPVNWTDPSGLCIIVCPEDLLPCILPFAGNCEDTVENVFSCLKDPFKCTYEQRSPLVRMIEAWFFEHSDGDVIPKEGGIRAVTNCTGICARFLDTFGQQAVTIGHTIFSIREFAGPFGQRLLDHELRHVRQYEIFGDLFLPLYLGPGQATGLVGCVTTGFGKNCLHDYNFFERWADY